MEYLMLSKCCESPSTFILFCPHASNSVWALVGRALGLTWPRTVTCHHDTVGAKNHAGLNIKRRVPTTGLYHQLFQFPYISTYRALSTSLCQPCVATSHGQPPAHAGLQGHQLEDEGHQLVATSHQLESASLA